MDDYGKLWDNYSIEFNSKLVNSNGDWNKLDEDEQEIAALWKLFVDIRAENCSDFSHVVQSYGRIVHEFYGTIYANKENGKLESNKRMWLYEKIHISILGNRVSVTYSKEV